MREAGEGAVEAPGASARDGVLAMSDRVLSRVCDDLRARRGGRQTWHGGWGSAACASV